MCDAGEFQHGRGDVHDGAERRADLALPGEARPGGEADHADAALGGEGLVQPRRRGGGLRPARAVPDERVGAAEIVEAVVAVLFDLLRRSADQGSASPRRSRPPRRCRTGRSPPCRRARRSRPGSRSPGRCSSPSGPPSRRRPPCCGPRRRAARSSCRPIRERRRPPPGAATTSGAHRPSSLSAARRASRNASGPAS